MAHNITGKVILHCHILIHEDFGMMMIADIVHKGIVVNQMFYNLHVSIFIFLFKAAILMRI